QSARSRGFTVGVMMATATVSAPSVASAHDLTAAQEARLKVIDAVLRSGGHSVTPLGRFAYQEQGDSIPTVRRYDIATGPLNDVVAAFERVSGVHLTFAMSSIGEVQSPGISGSFDVEHALQAMLAGTSVRVRLTSSASGVLDVATFASDV